MNMVQMAIIGLVVTVIALIIGLLGTILTIKALRMARSQTNTLSSVGASVADYEQRLKSLATSARQMAGELSTKAIGPYPDYVDEITDLLNRATSSIFIVSDVPCYSIFSGPKQWVAYKNALETAAIEKDKRTMQMAWMTSDRRKQLLKEQFKPVARGDAVEWKSGIIKERLKQFLETYARDKDVESLTYAEFESIVEDQHARMIHNLQGIRPKELKDRVHLMFWVANNKEAIFAIPNFTDRGQGQGFFTRDEKIINGLLSIHERLVAEGEEPKELSLGVHV